MADDNLTRATAAAFLEADPRVAAFEFVEGSDRLDVSLAAAAEWVSAERAAAYAGLESRILRQWQMVYDRSYRWDREIRPPDFEAWVSGFTGEAIPIPRMQTWLDDALAKMRSVPHARVIELGCGVGLVLAALAPGGTTYDGIDLSQEAIASLGAWVATQPALAHVRLAQRAAHEPEGVGDAELAILNSVVQYFPDVTYLERVLAAVTPRLAAGGALFLGDLRAAALLPMRAAAIAAARATPSATVAEVRAEADAVLGLARELAIDPAHLMTLGARLPRLGAVTYSLKPAAADHELAGYRYDAILRLDAPRDPPAPVASAPVGSLEAILAQLDAERPAAIVVQDLPNARLARDVALARALAAAAPETPLASLAAVADAAAIEPDMLAAEAKARGYVAELRFSTGSPEGRFDALLRRPEARVRWPDVPAPARTASDPLGMELAGKLRRDLQASLDAALGGRGRARVVLAT